jgi:parallel beta-helix repeat protein
MWTADVFAQSGSLSGEGFSTFSVGDGITLFLPYYNVTTQSSAPVFLLAGEKLNVSAQITYASGQCCVSSGSFAAFFTLGSPAGKLEGKTSLSYNATSKAWQGQFPIPSSADQGSWILTVNGTDSSGNSGSTYSWLNVGLNVLLTTDSPSYITGDTVTVFAAPLYPDGLITPLGVFNATVYSGSRAISEIPMSFNWVYGLWTGTFSILPSDPTGFYKVSVSGNDGAGNSGSFSTVIRVAPYHLSGQVILPSTSISMNGGSEPTVSAKLTYPNGTLMKSGSVEAFVSHVMDGTFVPIDHTRLSYQASTESFVGPNVLPPASILNTAPGEYLVSVQAFDASGNYGNLTSTFFVNANQRGAISISSNSQFTSANGVVGGTGTSSDPYLIAGWNTSSISISSNVSASYELLNDWVHGSGGNGIVINTPASTSSSIDNVYSISNHGNGLVVSNSTGVSIVRVDASNNSQDGILLSGVNQGNVQQSVAANNGGDGVVLESAPFFSILSTSATNNRNYGFYLFGSRNSTLFGDNATSNSVGVYVTGSSGHGYGGSEILGGYFVGNNIGIDVNGLHQNVSDNSSSLSSVSIDQTIQLENNIGTFAANDSVLGLEASVIGYNTWGVVVQNSLPLVVNNVISQNAAVGLNVTGSFSGTGHCIITFTNQTTFDYNSCIAINYLTLNGAAGLEMTNLNGSFIYQDAAVGNAANGFDLGNLRDSLVSTLISILNQGDGISLSGATGSEIVSNQIGGNLNGMLAKSSFGDAFDQNNASLNAFDGLVFSGSQNNTISNNTAIEDALFCSSSIGCTVAAGIELSNSSSNLLTLNQVTNITARAGSGAGIYIEAGSSNNTVRLNNSTLNFAGISIVDSSYNSIDNNTLVSDTYGIFLSNAPNNALSVNTYHGLEQYLYPNEPSVSFSNIVNGSSYSGKVVISWIATGQAISLQKLIIDGNPQNVTGSSFTLNSSNLSDGNHSLTITVTNSGGLSASASVVISTRNHEVLSVRALGPNGIVLPGITVNLTGSSTILNATTNSVGNALFSGLPAGSYLASALVNGSLVSAQVSFITNETVTLYVPRLITTVVATTSSGSTTSLTLDGNITSSNLSAVVLQNSNGVYNISFGISGITGALGRATLAIPKSAVPGGLVPEILLNGNPASNQSFSQTKDDYYVTFSASASAPGNVSIQFVHLVGFDPRLVVLAVIIVALLAGAIIVAYSRRRSPLNRALLGV